MSKMLLLILIMVASCSPSVQPLPLAPYAECLDDMQCEPDSVCRSFGESRRACSPACDTFRDCPAPTQATTAVAVCGNHRCLLACLDIATTQCPRGRMCVPFVGSPPYGYCQ